MYGMLYPGIHAMSRWDGLKQVFLRKTLIGKYCALFACSRFVFVPRTKLVYLAFFFYLVYSNLPVLCPRYVLCPCLFLFVCLFVCFLLFFVSDRKLFSCLFFDTRARTQEALPRVPGHSQVMVLLK